jgi:putative transposase
LDRFVEGSHVSVWKWVQKYRPKRLSTRRKRVNGYVVDETQIKVGSSRYMWLWVAIEPKHREILRIGVSVERAMLVAEGTIASMTNRYGRQSVSTDGGTWYPMACRFLKLNHHIHSPLEKSLMERTMQYIKDRTEGFDDYFPCRGRKCKLKHVKRWLNLFAYHHNSGIISQVNRAIYTLVEHIKWIFVLKW